MAPVCGTSGIEPCSQVLPGRRPMNSIRQTLKNADPLRTEPMPSEDQRDRSRRAVVAEAFSEQPESKPNRVNFGRLVILTVLALAVLLLGSQLSSFIGTKS